MQFTFFSHPCNLVTLFSSPRHNALLGHTEDVQQQLVLLSFDFFSPSRGCAKHICIVLTRMMLQIEVFIFFCQKRLSHKARPGTSSAPNKCLLTLIKPNPAGLRSLSAQWGEGLIHWRMDRERRVPHKRASTNT